MRPDNETERHLTVFHVTDSVTAMIAQGRGQSIAAYRRSIRLESRSKPREIRCLFSRTVGSVHG